MEVAAQSFDECRPSVSGRGHGNFIDRQKGSHEVSAISYSTYRSFTNNRGLDVDQYIYIAAIAAWLAAESDPSNGINTRIEIALNDTVCN